MEVLPIIIGPTASGKTSLAVDVALGLEERGQARGEIISADSMLVYRGLDVGAAKPTMQERRGVRHHLIDFCDPQEPFSVDDWIRQAERAIEEVRTRGAIPIVAGGAMLYIKTLLEGLFQGPPGDESLRESLAALSPAELREKLEQVDAEAALGIHPNDLRRTIRALEVHRLTGRPLSQWQCQWDQGRMRPDALLVGLQWPTQALNVRINERVRTMFDRGLLEEARALWSGDRLGRQAREALGYKQLISHFEGRCTLEEAAEQIKIETRRYAKNQRTWLRRLLTSSPRASAGEVSQSPQDSVSASAPLLINAECTPPAEQTQLIVDKALRYAEQGD